MSLTRDPAYGAQIAIYAALSSSAEVQAAVGAARAQAQFVYDSAAVPADPQTLRITADFPYITIGEDQVVGDESQYHDGSEIFAKVEIWSRAVDFLEAKAIAGAVRDALSQPLAIAGHTTVAWKFRGALTRTEPDGLTRRIIQTFRYLTEPALVTADIP